MTLIYRTQKGAPLTSLEVDTNFKELDTRLKHLEEHSEKGEGLGKVQVKGDQITFQGTFGSDFGTFTLPKATLIPRGLWKPQTLYNKLDLVTFENILYACLKEHVSTIWIQDYSLWQEVISLPKFALPLYEKSTLPCEEVLGKLALFLGGKGPTLIFFNGKNWQQLMKGDIL